MKKLPPLHLRYSSRLERLRLLSPKAAEVPAVVDQAALVDLEPEGPDLAPQARVAPAAQHPAKREPLSPVQRAQVDQAAEAAIPRRVCDAEGPRPHRAKPGPLPKDRRGLIMDFKNSPARLN